MKNKNQFYLIVTTLLFLSVFFMRVDAAKAGDYGTCVESGWTDVDACDGFDFPAAIPDAPTTPTDYGYTQQMCNDYYGSGYVVNSDRTGCDPKCSADQSMTRDGKCVDSSTLSDGGYNIDCSDYANTYAERGLCQCNSGYVRSSNGADCQLEVADVTGTSCGANTYKGRDGSCICNEGFEKRRDGGCYAIGVDIAPNSDGNTGSCDASDSCWFWNCCSSSTGASGSGGNSSPTPVATTTAPTNVGGRQIPTGTQVNSDGSATNPQTGAEIAPPGSFNVPSPGSVGNGGLVMCANGILAPECRDANGNNLGGIPVISSPRIIPGTGLGNVAGASGAVTPKCGANFQDIGGVCFPMNTGLSSTPIYVIVSNIFSWLMGLFTTLAILAFVISGIQYFMASGDEGMAEKAKENATHAIIGIIVGLSGFIIIKAIAAALTGQSMFF